MVGNIITKFYNNMMKKLYLLIIFFFLFYGLEKFPSYKKETYILGTNEGLITEFRIGLLNIFKPDEIQQGNIKITEITWQINTKENLTVWYHLQKEQWLPIDHYIWDKDLLF